MTTTSLIAFAPQLLASKADSSSRSPVMPDHREWIMEPKLDGWRFVFHVTADGQVIPYGRREGGVMAYRIPAYLTEELVTLFPPDSVVDCELVADGEGRQSTDVSTFLANHHAGTLTAYVFDAMRIGGIDMRDLPWNQRRWCIEKALDGATGPVRKTVVTNPSLEVFHRWLDLGLEGAVLKRRTSLYRSGQRHPDWVKLKPQKTIDLRIVGLPQDGAGKYSGMVGAVEFELPNGGTGRASGMTDEVRQEMTDHPERYLGRLAEFAYNQMTTGGCLRHPQFRRLREDLEEAAA
jgi:ATP-dependent DNA ligase